MSGSELDCVRPAGLRGRVMFRYLGVDRKKSRAAAAGRQAFPITAYVGANGAGKSMCAVYDSLPVLLDPERYAWECDNPKHPHTLRGEVRGYRTVLSTVRLVAADGSDHPLYVPLTSFVGMLANAYHCDVILDEVTGVADSHDHASLPTQVRNLVTQLRRRDCRLRWTTPDWQFANVRLRRVTQAVVYCRGAMKTRAVQPGRQWRDTRSMRWATYDAAAFDEFTHSKRQTVVPEGVQHFWRPGHLVERSYDTLAEVFAMGAATEGGMCQGCGGRRSLPKCSCPVDPEALADGVAEEVTAAGVRRRVLLRDTPSVLSPLPAVLR